MQGVAVHVEDEHTHHFALNHNDTALAVHANATRMLQNGGAKFANELAILVAGKAKKTIYGFVGIRLDLNLMSWRTFSDHKIAGDAIDGDTVWVEKLAI